MSDGQTGNQGSGQQTGQTGSGDQQQQSATQKIVMDADNWREFIPEEHRAEKSLESLKSFPDMVKGYVHGQKLVGSSVRLPKPDAPEEERKAFLDDLYGKLGRPTKPEEYKVQVPEVFQGKNGQPSVFSEDIHNSFKGLAHQIGLNDGQVQALVNWQADQFTQSLKTADTEYITAVGDLKARWGPNYAKNQEIANRAFKTIATPKQAAIADALGILNQPEMVEMFYNVGNILAEHNVIPGAVEGVTTKGEAQAKIDAILADPKHAYRNPRDPGHAGAQKQVSDLFRIVHGDRQYPTG